MPRFLRTITMIGASAAAGFGIGYGAKISKDKGMLPPPLRWHTGIETSPPEKLGLEERIKRSRHSTAIEMNNLALLHRGLHGSKAVDYVTELLSSAYLIDPTNEVVAANYRLSCLAQVDLALMAKNTELTGKWLDKAKGLSKEISGKKETTLYVADGYYYQRLASMTSDQHHKTESLNKAVDSYQTAHALSPKNKVIICLIGEAFRDLAFIEKEAIQADSFQQAVKFFNKAITLDKDYGLAHFRLGEIYLKYGRVESGKAEIARAFDLYRQAPQKFPKEFQGENHAAFFDQIPEFPGKKSLISSFNDLGTSDAEKSSSPR